MKKLSLSTWTASLGLALLACTSGCTITTDDGGGGDGDGDGDGDGTVDLSNITADHTISEDVTVDGDINVRNGATLTIAPGTTIRMSSSHWLRVEDGVLKADGTADEPIVIRGVDDGKGRFLGVELGSDTRTGTSLSFVTIDGGGEDTFGDRGCLKIDGVPADRVSLVDVTLQNCAQAGLRLTGTAPSLAAFDRITVNDSDAGVAVSVEIAGEVDERITTTNVDENRLLANGDVVSSYTLTAQNEAWHVDNDLDVGGTGTPVLTIEPGTTIRFEGTRWLRVGGNDPGGLVAVGTAEAPIVFSRVDAASTSKGDWLGLVFDANTLSGTTLEHVVVEGAGQNEFNTRGCISVGTGIGSNKLALRDVTLRQCGIAGLGIADGVQPLSAFERVTFDTCDTGLSTGIAALAGVTEAAVYVDTPNNRILETGDVVDDLTIVTQPVFFAVEGDIEVRENALLTLQAGTELRFSQDSWFRVSAGRVVADGTADLGVTLGAIDTGSTGGGWLGVFFEDATLSGTALRYTLVQQGGADNFGSRGGINVLNSGGEVTLDNVTFANNAQADVFHTCESAPTLLSTAGNITNDCF